MHASGYREGEGVGISRETTTHPMGEKILNLPMHAYYHRGVGGGSSNRVGVLPRN